MTELTLRSPYLPCRTAVFRSTLLAGCSVIALLAAGIEGAGARPLGGPSAPAPTAAAAAAAQAGAQQATSTAARSLANITRSLQAMRNTQTAARAAALAGQSQIPNGLASGGLVVAPGAGTVTGVWVGADLPTQTQAGSRTQVEVKQTAQKAILNWSKFNVGRETDLYFNQQAGGADAPNWIALNRVTDPSLEPSRILGTIKAEGQVYVTNRNGIIFGGSSQINVHTLVASSLSLSNEQFLAGINTPLSILGGGGNDYGLPTFGDHATVTPNEYVGVNGAGQVAPLVIGAPPGDVLVEAGASIDTAVGGKAMLFAPHVTNAGAIRAPDGQVILAAGENVWLVSTNVANSSVRGLEVAVSSVSPFLMSYYQVQGALGLGPTYGSRFIAELGTTVLPAMDQRAATVGYAATNNGVIEVSHGNITMQSRSVTQNGILYADTALNNREGSILLRAWGQGMMAYSSDFDSSRAMMWRSSGTLTLGQGSITTVMVDLSDTSTIEGSSLATRYSPGRIDLRGYLIDIERDATVFVPAGSITAVASSYTAAGTTTADSRDPARDGSRVYIDEGAILSVAGITDVLLAMESNLVSVDLRINELRDSVLYKNTWLSGQTIIVDKRASGTFTDGPMAGVNWGGAPGAWVGTPLADVSAWLGTNKTTLAELSTIGGSIVLKAGGDVITRQGSVLDVSGGSVTYDGGYINTTHLIDQYGAIYDIANATPDRIYIGIASGNSFVRTSVRWGITEVWTSMLGRGRARYENGYTEGRAAGSIQIYNGAGLVLEGDIAAGVISGGRQMASGSLAKAGSLQFGAGSSSERTWIPSTVVITNDPTRLAGSFMSTSALSAAFYDPVPGDEYRSKTTYLDADILGRSGLGTINIFYNKAFEVAAGTRLELSPGTALNVTSNSGFGTTAKIDGAIRIAGGSIALNAADTGMLSLGANAVLDVSGRWINDFAGGGQFEVAKISGGSVTLGTVTAHIEEGAVIDLSGGAWLKNQKGKVSVKLGDAGSIGLQGLTTADINLLDVRAIAPGSGGTLRLTTRGDVQLGGAAPADPAVLYLSETLLGEKGFRSVSISTSGDVVVPDGVTLQQIPTSLVLSGAYFSAPTDTPISEVGTITVLPDWVRATRSPSAISVSTSKQIIVGAGSTLATDIGGSIALSSSATGAVGDESIRVKGTIAAPSGSISLTAPTLLLSATAKLKAIGTALIDVDVLSGRRMGEVRDGGSVTISGAMSLAAGSVIDVSGTSDVIHIGSGRSWTPTTIDSDGGSITLSAGNAFGSIIDATLRGKAGGSNAIGGTLTISDASTTNTTLQNPGISTSYLGYFSYVGTGGKYNYDPVTKQYSLNSSSNGAYNFVGNLGTSLDLDIYDEYGTAVLRIGTASTYIRSLPIYGLGYTRIVDGLAAAAATESGATLKPSTYNASITDQIAHLVDTYIFTATRALVSGVYVYTPTAKINVKDLQPLATTVSSGAINNGGFSALNVNAPAGLKLNNGVALNLPNARISLNAPQIVAPGTGAMAEIHAAYVSLARAGNSSATIANTAPTSGTLTIDASLIDVYYAFSRGYGETRLTADEIRFIAPSEGVSAKLNADATLTLKAAQIYPTSRTVAEISAVDKIVVLPNGTASAPWSAAGSLVLTAPDIEVRGTLRAPFGSISLNAVNSIKLDDGAVVSVSGDGLLLPYGTIYDTDYWALITGTSTVTTLSALPEKKITLSAPRISQASGATLDISGGGDLYASEFVVGTGGSRNVLAMSGVYAIVPASGSASAAVGTGLAVGARIWLDGGKGISAGWYTLLPASYALLPGAMAVQMVAGTTGNPIARANMLSDGTVVVSGRLGNQYTGAVDQLASSWRVMSGDVIRKYSEFNEATANRYFSSDAFKLSQYRLTGVDVVTPRLPMDGGSLVLMATQRLVLDGQVRSQAAGGGRGGWVDIAATNIALVGSGHDVSDLAGYLILDTARLSVLGAESLMIGGVRSGTTLGTGVSVMAASIVVRNDADSALTGPELILAASDTLTVDAGSVLRTKGEIAGGGGDLIMTKANSTGDYGALIRLSNGDVVNVIRTDVDTSSSHGVVDIRAGALLDGGRALIVEATRDTSLAGAAVLSGRDITLGASRVSFGAGGSGGLIFDATALARFAATENLTLRSYSTIDFFAGVDFGSATLKSVTLDTAGLVARTGDEIVIAGDIIRLRNTVGAFAEPGVTDQASLRLEANDLVLSSGAKALRGFGTVVLSGNTRIVGEGAGSLDAGGAGLTLISPLITGRGGATQSVATAGVLTIVSGGGAPVARDAGSLGSQWSLTGASVDFGGRIDALGGSVALTAANGAVNVGAGAVIDVGGLGKQFYDVTEYADAGSISLTAFGGGINVRSGSTLKLAAAGGGNAGTLSAVAANSGTVVLDGTIDATASNGRGGKFNLDIAALPDYAGFSQRLDAAGFTASRSFRIRNGNVVIDGNTVVEDFALTTDVGTVVITGTITANKAYGGSISVVGGNGLTMEGSASLRAASTAALGGGRVLLDAGDGRLDIKGGTIDVAGGEGGKVRFRARQVAGPDYVAVDHLAATITGARSSVLEGVWRPTGSVSIVDAALIADAKAASDMFITHAAGIAARLNGAGGVAIMPGVEIRSDGDLMVSQDVDLATFAAREGGLTLRAAGNLDILANISDGFDQVGRDGILLNQSSWDIRLVAGADLTSADPLTVAPGSTGAVTLGDAANGYLVRTGTGDLTVRAAGDLLLANPLSAIYTAGRKDPTVYSDFVQYQRYIFVNNSYVLAANPVYGIDGGNVSISAGGNVRANIPDDQGQLFTEWLLRQGKVNVDGVFTTPDTWDSMWPYYLDPVLRQSGVQQSAWWIDYSMFQHGIGALGGGNLSLTAGGDVTDLTVVVPTNGQVRGGRTLDEAKTLVVRNGGALDVDVAGTIYGGQYYVGRGSARIAAGSLSMGVTKRTTTKYSGSNEVNELLPMAPILALGDSDMTVRTAGDMIVQTVADPLMIRLPLGTGGSSGTYDYGSYMTLFTERTALALVSVGGDITIGGPSVFNARRNEDVTYDSTYTRWMRTAGDGVDMYPAVTHIVALNGAVTNTGQIRTMPASNADFAIIAEDTIVPGNIVLARNQPARLPTPFRPAGATGSTTQSEGITGLIQGRDKYGQLLDNPETLLLAEDMEASRIYSASGSVVGRLTVNNVAGTNIIANEQLWIRAGGDIRDLTIQMRNIHQTDVSWLDAGNDISSANLTVQGPGSILLTASRDIYAPRVYTVGNGQYDGNNRPVLGTEIKGLPSNGAAIELIAGLSGNEPAYEAFVAAYLDPANVATMPAYLTTVVDGQILPLYFVDANDGSRSGKKTVSGLVSFVESIAGESLSPLAAWSVFRSLPALTQERFLRQVYFQELRASGRSQSDGAGAGTGGGYDRGYKAIEILFPGYGWAGDIVASSIFLRTMAGGDILAMTPGGGLQVASLQKAVPVGDGIVTLGYGNIEIFARDDVTVNRSRVLTFAGGDEIIWSTLGDIDAGRGAKTTRVPSAPDVTTDADTVTHIIEKADMSGSGIGTVEGFTGVEPGDVDLIAPRGTVNAGDAGIRVSGNLSVAALFVLNFDNIKVTGDIKGVPKKESAPAINLTAETKDKAAADAAKDATQAPTNDRPSIIIVEVLGFGGGDRQEPQGDDEEKRRRDSQRSYDFHSPFQVVGAGRLNQLGESYLNDVEKQLLRRP